MDKPFQSPGPSSLRANLRIVRLVATLRRGEVGLVVAAFAVGAISGAAVALLGLAIAELHLAIFGVRGTVSGGVVDQLRAVAGPAAGGAVLAAFMVATARRSSRPIVDPIEANALYGGRMSLTDSIILCAQNVISNGFGASVGLEAGYTQLAGGLASKLGQHVGLRRGDIRILVGCGAAGAIASAFGAPLTGAFYAIELVIGTYTVLTLAPVMVAAMTATLVARQIAPAPLSIEIGAFVPVGAQDYLPAILLGVIAALVGIGLMQAVSFIEIAWRRSPVGTRLRPAIGGLCVGALALITPQVLSAGHGALHLNLVQPVPLAALARVFLLKALASAVSIGSGFRGGLFFASLFLGVLLGKIFSEGAGYLGFYIVPMVYAVVGMSALATSVIGGPLTMTFLALEMTGDFPITTLVLAAVVSTSLVVRTTFGYSFATWRFHLRGETIRSAHDVGWIRDLTVSRMMRSDVRTADIAIGLAAFRAAFPLGSTQRVVMVDGRGRYLGMLFPAEVHAHEAGAETFDDAGRSDILLKLLKQGNDVLLPGMNIKEAAAIFERTRSEALAVVDNLTSNKPIGLLTEAHTLRRYSEELDMRQREISGAG